MSLILAENKRTFKFITVKILNIRKKGIPALAQGYSLF